MSADLLLTFNAGSSTVKIGLFETDASGARRVARGVIDFRKPPLNLHITEGPSTFKVDLEAEASDDLRAALPSAIASFMAATRSVGRFGSTTRRSRRSTH